MFKGGVLTKYSPEQLLEAIRTATIACSPGGIRMLYLRNTSTGHHFCCLISMHFYTHLWTQNAWHTVSCKEGTLYVQWIFWRVKCVFYRFCPQGTFLHTSWPFHKTILIECRVSLCLDWPFCKTVNSYRIVYHSCRSYFTAERLAKFHIFSGSQPCFG